MKQKLKKIYKQGNYSDREIIEIINKVNTLLDEKENIKIFKNIGEFKLFGKFLQKLLETQSLTKEELIDMSRNPNITVQKTKFLNNCN